MPTLDWLNRDPAFRAAVAEPTRALRPRADAVGVDNPLFYKENNRMLFGDAKKMLDEVLVALRA
jgi:hypothetical protein